ncbi:MAG: FapA family protein, partial [Phycisphaerae bacterium]|nr:FapA family protein [Phycisphaerae bacterium]
MVDDNGNIVYEGGRLMVGEARVQITADDVDVNSMIVGSGGILELQPVRFDTSIGLTGTRATVEAVVESGQVTGFTNLWGGRGYSSEPLVTMPPPGERAFGVASILNGQVTGINLVYGGTRYNASHPPTISIVGGGQSGETPVDQATATATYDADGVVTGFTITNAGSGYYTAPTVVVLLPGAQATARATIENGVVVGFQILNPGSNYAAAPTVTVAQPYVFDLDGDEIAFFQDGFDEVIIGREDGSHTFYSPMASFQDNLRLRAPRIGGNFQTESLLIESGGGLIIVGSGQTYHLTTANPITSGSFIEIDDSVRVDDGVNGQITATDTHVSIFGVGKGKIDGETGSITENLTITAGTTITVTGAIGSQDPLTDLTLNSAGGSAVGLQQNVTLDGDLRVVNSGALSLDGDLIIGGDLIIDNATNISFSGTVTVTGDLIITSAGTINFAQNIQVGGDLIIGSLINPTGVASVTFASTARLDVVGSVAVYTASQITFGASVGQSSPPTSMTLLSNSGDVAFQDVTSADVITIIKARDVTFVQELTTDQLIITNATGQARVQRLAVLGTADITVTDFVQVQAGLQITGGNATITSNEIDFAGGTGTVLYTGAGSGTLTLKPRTTSRAITLGSPPGVFTSMDLSDADLAAIGAGFEQVIIGDVANGTGAVTIGDIGLTQGLGNSQLLNSTSIYGGSVNIVQDMDAADGVNLIEMVARTGNILVNGEINSTTTDRSAELRLQTLDPTGQVIINQPVYATNLIAIVSGHAVSTGASGTVNAPNLRVTAGD